MDLAEEARQAFEERKLRAQTRGMLGVDADKEKAAQAIQLQNQTGADANMIYENHDEFARDYKSYLTQNIIGRDPAIRSYVDNYPMGAKVSKDDWGNISEFNEKLDALSPHLPGSGIVGKAIRKAVESFDTSSLTAWMDDADPGMFKGPLGMASYVAWGALGAPVVLTARSFHAGLEGLNQALTEIGGPRFARDITGATEQYLMGTAGVHSPIMTYQQAATAVATKTLRDAFRAAKPYLQAGERPPIGTHPLWDEALAAEKISSMKVYDEAMDAAKKVETRELSPDAMAAIVETKNKGSIYVNSEAVHKLYGDKVPEPGDGLLGDVPEFAKQFEESKTTGADIDVKWSDWIARVPDEVSKALRDDLRWRPGDLTLKEAEEIPKAKEVLGPPKEEPPIEPISEQQFREGAPPFKVEGLPKDDPRVVNISENLSGLANEVESSFPSISKDLRVLEGDLRAANDTGVDTDAVLERLGRQLDLVERNVGPSDRLSRLSKMVNDLEDVMDQPLLQRSAYQGKVQAHYKYYVETLGHIQKYGDREALIKSLEQPYEPKSTDKMFNYAEELAFKHGLEAIRPKETVPTIEDSAVRNERLKEEYKDQQEIPEILENKNIRHALQQAVETRAVPRELSKGLRWAALNGRPDIVFSILDRADKLDPKLGARFRADIEALQNNKDAIDSVKGEMAQRPLFPAGWMTHDPVEWKSIQDLVASGEWEQIGRKTVIKPTTEWLAKEREVVDRLFDLLGKIAPDAAITLRPALEVRMGETPTPVQGAYIPFRDLDPIISVSVNALDPVGTLRHELVHFFRDYGFFTRAEWKVLRDAAIKEWIKKHNIINRYPGARAGQIIEEGIAEEYAAWGQTRETTSAVGKIFQKVLDFLTNAKIALKQIFGRDLTPSEIFTQIETGRVGTRELREPIPIEQHLLEPSVEKAQVPPAEVPPIEKETPMFAPGALLPKDRYAKYMRLIDKINDKDVQKLYNDAVREERKRQTPEWNREAAKMYTEVREDINNRRDFRTSDFFRNGKFGDQILEDRPKIDPKWLTPEEKAIIPSRFMSKGGFNPDELAGSFGYKTGREMIDDMVKFENAKGEDKPGIYRDKVVASEVERRMRMRFGDLDENIMREAREHAIGLEQFDLLYEETLQLADMLKQQFPLTKENLRAQAALKFNDTPQRQAMLVKYTREIGRAGRDAEKAFLSGDVAGAFAQKQRQVQLHALAEYAVRFEKERARFERAAKRFNKREVDGLPPEYTNWIHDILFRVDRPPRRSRADLDDNIGRHVEKTLKDFAEKRNSGLPEGYEEFEVDYNPSIPIWEKLLDPDFSQSMEGMTVGEFRAVNNSIQALIKHGREVETVMREGKEADRQHLVGLLVDQLQGLRERKVEVPVEEPKGVQRAKKWGKSMFVGLLQLEAIWERIDRGKIGLFTRQFALPFSRAGNEFAALQREFSRKVRELNKYKVDLNEKIENNIFREPLADVPDDLKGGITEPSEFLPMTRGNLRAVLLNVGNPSNLDKLARGYGTTPEAIMDWVNRHAKPEDWEFAKGMGRIFDEIQDKADIMTMNMTGTTIEKLPLGTVETPSGPVDGWYYPMIYDRNRGGGKRVNIDINPPPLIRAMTARGFERPRTGYAGPVWLTLSEIDNHIGQRLRDIAFREIITDTQKIFNDLRFQAAMTRNLGPHYTALLMPYLRDLAGMRAPTAGSVAAMDRFFETLRVNTIGTLIGWNPGTVLKHTPTAYVQSFKELDNPLSLLAATKDIVGVNRKKNNKFMMEGAQIGDLDWKGSAELQRRLQHWIDTLGGALDEVVLNPTFRHRAIEVGAWAIARSDLFASKALWLAKYNEVFEKLQPSMKIEQAHTEAVDLADRAVRRTHGSTAVTSRPELMRLQGALPKYLTSLYGFFNHMFNRYYRMSWKTKEMMKDVGRGEPVLRDVQDLASDFFFYVVAPAVIEEWVSPQVTGEEHGILYKMAMTLSHPVTSSVPVLRDVAHAARTGHDPASGILTASTKAVTDMVRSLGKGPDFYNFGDQLLHMSTLAGIATGLPGQQVGRWSKFLYNYYITRMEDIKEPGDIYRAFRYGTAREPKGH